jgi:hypothetical protein
MHIPDELTGSWKGEYTYGEAYPGVIAGKTVEFNIDIDVQTGETFSGNCHDLDEHISASFINGKLTSSLIQFTKQYTVRRWLKRDGFSFVQVGKPGHRVNYTGRWNEERHCFQGEWQMAVPDGLLYQLFSRRAHKGTWQMESDEEPAMLPIEELKIKMHYRKEELEAVYFYKMESVKQNRRGLIFLFYLVLAAMVGCVIFYLLAMAFEVPGFIALSLLSLLIVFWLCTALVKNIQIYLKWKAGAKSDIAKLVADKYHTLTLNPTSLSIDKPDEVLIERWENIKKIRILTDCILLSGDEPKHMFFATSMQPEEYELLKKYLLTYVKK